MNTERPRIATTGLLVTVTIAIVATLWVVYAAVGLRDRVVENAAPSELTAAYLEAWLRIEPRNTTYLLVLGKQYQRLGRNRDALRIAAQIDALDTAPMHAKAQLLRLKIAEQLAFAIAPDEPARELGLAQVRRELIAAADFSWDSEDLETLAADALAVAAPDLALTYYQRLATQDSAHREHWQLEVARQALASGNYRLAATAYTDAQTAAANRNDRRRDFLASVRALQAGNLMDEAVNTAERNVGDLADDKSTLAFLLNLARAAHRPDLVDRYARELMKYAGRDTGQEERVAVELSPSVVREPQAYTYSDGPRGGATRSRFGDAHIWHTAAAAYPEPAPSANHAVDKTNIAALLYTSFLEANDLANAEKIALDEVALHPASAIWQQRLAQVAEWHNDPALALKSWLAYAALSNDAVAWQNVLRIAPMLDDDKAYVRALAHASAALPDDLKLVDQVIAADERLGLPNDGLAFLRDHTSPHHAEEITARYAALAERAGLNAEALDTYRQLQKADPRNLAYALKTANLLYQQGDYAGAFAALQIAEPYASDRDTLYWRTNGQLARLLQRDDASNRAYRHLLAGGQETPEDLAAMTYFYDLHPIDAGRTAELKYHHDQDLRSLRDALYYYTEAHMLDEVRALLESLTATQLHEAERNPDFLSVRAEYFRQTEHLQDALQDLTHAIALPGASTDLRASYLWILVDVGSEHDLRVALARWRTSAASTPGLWGAFAAAEMRLNRPRAALDYLRRQAALSSRDPLWLLSYADAQEMAGRSDLAWSIRRHVWRQMLAARFPGRPMVPGDRSGSARAVLLSGVSDTEAQAQLNGRRVSLAQTFADGDVGVHMLNQLMRSQSDTDQIANAVATSLLGNATGTRPLPSPGEQQMQAQQLRQAIAQDVAIAWALSREANPLAKRWLAQRYAHRLSAPDDSQLAIALAEGDTATMERLLDSHRVNLPLYNRIDASILVDRPGAAQALAFTGLDGAPEDPELHERLVDTSMTWAPAIDTSVESYIEHPLDYVEQTLGGSLKLDDLTMIGSKASVRYQRSTDATQLVEVPAVDRSLEFFLRRQTHDSAFNFSVGRREAMEGFYTANALAEIGRESPLTMSLAVGRNQTATESQTLQVGGVKDNLIGNLIWQASSRWSVSGNVEADRFYSQDRSYLGSGVLSQGEVDFKIRTTYPDYTLRAVAIHGDYNASGQPDALLSRLVPATDTPNDASTFMPRSYTEYGAFAGFGNDLIDHYTHAWRPFADIGIVHDSLQGWGLQTNVGIAGTVFGGDHAALYLEHERVSQSGTPVTLVGARYSWFY